MKQLTGLEQYENVVRIQYMHKSVTFTCPCIVLIHVYLLQFQ